MSIEVSHGKARVTGPRLSDQRDHADGANAVDRARHHDAHGRFARGNRAAVGTGPKRAVRHLVCARGRRVYEAIVRGLGPEPNALACMHAADAVNNHVASSELHEAARAKGIATPEGIALLERAQRASELASRASVAALECARLLRHPRTRAKKNVTPVGYEDEETSK